MVVKLLLITALLVYCSYAKMLKKTETEDTIGFFHIFIIGVVSIGGEGGGASGPLLATPMIGGELLLKNGTTNGYAY